MIDLNELKNFLKKPLEENNFILTCAEFNYEDGETILHCEVTRKNPKEAIDMALIEQATEIISNSLDEIEEQMPETYMLNVESAGAEREIEVKELDNLLGEYVEVHLNEPIKDENILTGTIEEVTQDEIKLKYFIKGRKKIQDINKSNILKAKLVVKI